VRINTTARYTRVAIQQLKDVVARTHPREKQWKRRGGRA
jgi:site-specific recombinase XerD